MPNAEVKSWKSEEESNSAPNIPQSELEEHSALNIPHSEIKELPTANSKLFQRNSLEQTEKMEVHHHPEVEKKNIKEYLLEGLMIFVAVMMGFIAENVRENITAGEHARQLTSQLVRDLKADTTELNEVYRAEKQIGKENDTLFEMLQRPVAKADTKKIQRFVIGSFSLWPFYPSTGAIGAIKNEIHLKQFTNADMIGHIARYEGRTALLHKIEDIESEAQKSYLESFCRLHFTPANLKAAFNHATIVDGQMRNVTQNDFTQLSADIVLIRTFNSELVEYNRKLKNDAANLIDYVKKQYDLEDE